MNSNLLQIIIRQVCFNIAIIKFSEFLFSLLDIKLFYPYLSSRLKSFQIEDCKNFSTEAQTAVNDEHVDEIDGKEKVIGDADRHEFQAETAELLNIVAKSLYSENEVSFVLNVKPDFFTVFFLPSCLSVVTDK